MGLRGFGGALSFIASEFRGLGSKVLCVQDLDMISGSGGPPKRVQKVLEVSTPLAWEIFAEEWAADSGCRADVDFRLQVADFFFKSYVSLQGNCCPFGLPGEGSAHPCILSLPSSLRNRCSQLHDFSCLFLFFWGGGLGCVVSGVWRLKSASLKGLSLQSSSSQKVILRAW